MAKIPFHGIVAVGNTKSEALAQYRALAKGNDVSLFADEGKSLSFVSNSSALAHVFNPMTGDMDMGEAPELLKGLSFASESSTESRDVNHYECKAGCGGHVVYDSEQLLKFCPICTTSISSDEQDDSEDDADTDEDDDSDAPDSNSDEDDEDMGDESDSSDDDEGDDPDDDDEGDDSDADDEGMGDESESDDGDADEDDTDGTDVDSDDDADDEGDDSDADDGDDTDEEPIVVAASSKRECIRLFMKHRPVATSSGDAEVEYLCCSNADCGAHVMSEVAISACPACDAALIEPVVANQDDVNASDDDEGDDEAGDDNDLSLVDYADDEGDEGDNSDASESADGDDSDCEGDDCSDDADDADDADEGTEGDDDASDDSDAADASESAGDESDADNANTDNADEGDDSDTDADAGGEDIDVDALDEIDDSDDQASESFDVSYSGSIAGRSQWTAWFKGKPVATATAADVGKNADIFDTQDFGRACLISAKHAGVKNTLKEMGFKPLIHTVSISHVVAKQVEDKVEEIKQQVEKDSEQHAERLQAAMATAAIGITRGFFTGIDNPLKSALHQALSASGVKNPEVMIHNAFKNSADAYHKVLFDKASEIMSRPAEVQESLAKAVLETNYLESQSTSSARSSVETRLANIGDVAATAGTGTGAKSEAVQESTSSTAGGSFSQRIADVVGSLGRKF